MKNVFALASLMILCASAGCAEVITLKPTTTLTTPRKLGLRPQSLTLEAQTPPTLRKLPEGLARPQFGRIALGVGEGRTEFLIAVSEAPGRDTRILVDADGDGDLTNDPAPTLVRNPYIGRDGTALTQVSGTAVVEVRYSDTTLVQPVNFVRNDPRDPALTATRDLLLYTLEVGRAGEAKFGERTLTIGLLDTLGTGDYAGRSGSPVSGVMIMVDANGSKSFDPRGEAFDTRQPFTIGGLTYEVRNVSPDGTRLEIVKSEKKALEIPPTPDLRPGKKVLPFRAKTLEGKIINFPGDFKGKLVLLIFWASWCGDCQREIPQLAASYAKLSGEHLEFLGVSLDHPNSAPQLKAYRKQNRMPWPEIYDGKFWDAEVAYLYGINWIPTLYLINGTTGEVLAAGNDLLGDKLIPTLKKQLSGSGSSLSARK